MPNDARATVLAAIRDHVDAAYPAWRRRVYDPIPTRSGERYLAAHLADLVAPPLEAVGLRVYDDLETDAALLVTAAGRHWTHAAVSDLIRDALAGHKDRVLAESVTRALPVHIGDRLPVYVGDVTRAPRPTKAETLTAAEQKRLSRERLAADEEESARAFLRAARARLPEVVPATDLYAAAVRNVTRKVDEGRASGDASIPGADGRRWRPPGKSVFWRVADRIGRRVRRSAGYVYVVNKLRSATVEAMIAATRVLGYGPSDPAACEAYADEAVQEILDRAPQEPPEEELDPRVQALPYQVAYAVAGADHGGEVAAFTRSARFHLSRHPEDREAVARVAASLQGGDPEGLADQIRARVGAEVAAEGV